MRKLAAALSFLLAAILTASAQQRPLMTDDIDITPPGKIEIGAGVDFFQDAKFPLSGIKGDLTRVGDIRIRQGFAANVELQIEGVIQQYVAINSRTLSPIPLNVTGNSTNDFGDFIISAKVKLRAETKRLPAIGLKFGYEMPNTDQAKGIGTNQINIFSKIILQKKFGNVVGNTPKFNAYGNIGLGIMTAPLERFSQNDVLLYGLAGIYRLTENVNIASESERDAGGVHHFLEEEVDHQRHALAAIARIRRQGRPATFNQRAICLLEALGGDDLALFKPRALLVGGAIERR